MKNSAINRRVFLKFLATYCLIMPHVNAASLDMNANDNTSSVLAVDHDFVIMNGWVLLKSDVPIKDVV